MNNDIYREFILDLYRNPHNKKTLEVFDVELRGHNPGCGDEYSIRIKLTGDTIADIGYTGDGCAISHAALSLVTDEVCGKTKADIAVLTRERMLALLDIPIDYTREKCAMLGLDTIQKALL